MSYKHRVNCCLIVLSISAGLLILLFMVCYIIYVPPENFQFVPPDISDGQLVGVWKIAQKKRYLNGNTAMKGWGEMRLTLYSNHRFKLEKLTKEYQESFIDPIPSPIDSVLEVEGTWEVYQGEYTDSGAPGQIKYFTGLYLGGDHYTLTADPTLIKTDHGITINWKQNGLDLFTTGDKWRRE